MITVQHNEPASKLVPVRVYTAGDIRALLKCSLRHVWRMRDAGLMPPPFKAGRLVRWDASTVDLWINRGCPPVRQAGHRR